MVITKQNISSWHGVVGILIFLLDIVVVFAMRLLFVLGGQDQLGSFLMIVGGIISIGGILSITRGYIKLGYFLLIGVFVLVGALLGSMFGFANPFTRIS